MKQIVNCAAIPSRLPPRRVPRCGDARFGWLRLSLAAGAWVLAALVSLGAAEGRNVTFSGRVVLVNPNVRKRVDNSNAAVWLTSLDGTPNNERATPRRFRLIQQYKRFTPHVLVVPVGSVVEFPNLDPFFHNVFSLFEGERFDLGLYEAGTTHAVSFDRPGVSYIFCNIHPEMSAVVVAVATPFYAVSDRSGGIAIPDVPPGRYLLHAWHERCTPEVLKAFPREILVSEKEESFGTIRLTESEDLVSHHKNKYAQDYIPPNPPGSLYGRP
jgi:plastocyanin